MARRSKQKSFWFPLLGLGFAVAGADKVLGSSGYLQMFRRLGLSEAAMSLIGAGEFAGGVLVASKSGRRIGGLILTMASTAVLTSEMRQGDDRLALPRSLLLLSSVIAAASPAPVRSARSGTRSA